MKEGKKVNARRMEKRYRKEGKGMGKSDTKREDVEAKNEERKEGKPVNYDGK
jgi:hypothetical protein